MASLRMLRQECQVCGKAASVEVMSVIGALVGAFCRKHGMATLADLERSERAASLTIPKNPLLSIAEDAQAEATPPITEAKLVEVNEHVASEEEESFETPGPPPRTPKVR